jgi:5-oxopent-3-ene-1,2,5-tricarboxylate decarboxylase / 2-hydroxyhepta-2,4-diene-1,7-dioate isomerase
MKHARVAFAGAIHEATQVEGRLRLADGRFVGEEKVVWLPPFQPRTIFAVGLNYSSHAKELALGQQKEPLVFLKSSSTIAGHCAETRRPAGVSYMHYECELAVVIGKPAYKLSREDAFCCVAGYTVANDYAIRDYLENYYRPNLRAKNRDGSTLLGPWLVDAEDIPLPVNLSLKTIVNGKVIQKGNTQNMVFDIPFLIEYLSGFMTLSPWDVILTGTPEGVADVKPGDEVVAEVEGVGQLANTIVDDEDYQFSST